MAEFRTYKERVEERRRQLQESRQEKRVHTNKFKEMNKKQNEPPVNRAGKVSQGDTPTQNLHALTRHIYTKEEIQHFQLNEAIENHPLSKRPTGTRSKLAYRELFNELSPTTKYLLPGWVVCFHYDEPKYKEELEYYDKVPLTLFLGITRTKEGNIREVGLNLHYFPPYTREKILNNTFRMFRSYFEQNFNDPAKKPNMFISWKALQHIMKRDAKLAFGIKMYIPSLRRESYKVPTRLLGTAFYTEGVFSKATRHQVMHFWRQFNRF